MRVSEASTTPSGLRTPDSRLSGADLLLFLIVLGTYLRTMARDLAWGDSSELALIAATGGVSHPTGYPLYTLILKLVSRLTPWGAPVAAAAVSVFSAAAAFLVMRRATGHLGVRPWLGRGFCLLLAFSREVWVQASVPEVYAMQLLLTALLLEETVREDLRPERAAFLAGLSLTHHLLSLFLVPGLAWAVVTRTRGTRRPWVQWGICFALPLAIYLRLPLEAARGAPLAWGQPTGLGALIEHVSGQQFAYRMMSTEATGVRSEMFARLRDLLTQLDPIGAGGFFMVVLAVLGARTLGRGGHRLPALLFGAASTFCFAITYTIPDKEAYFFAVTAIVVLLAATGAEQLVRRAQVSRAACGGGQRAGNRIVLSVLMLSLVPFVLDFRRADHSDDRSMRDYLTDVVSATDPRTCLVVVENLSVWMAAVYLTKVEGRFEKAAFFPAYLAPLPWALEQFGRLYPGIGVPAGLVDRLRKHREVLGLDGRPPTVKPDEVLAYLEKEILDEPLSEAQREEQKSRVREDPQGYLSHLLAEWVQREMVAASVADHPCFFVPHRYDHTPARWHRFHVLDRGVVYGLSEAPKEEPIPLVAYSLVTDYSADTITLPEKRRLARRYASILNRFGLVHINRGALKEAELELLRAVSHDPGYAAAYGNLGVLYERYLKNPGVAAQHYRRCVELDPDGAQAPAIRAWLSQHP